MGERWDQVQEIFAAAADLPHEDRPRYLDERCGADAELRAEVESLLAAEQGAASLVVGAIGRAAVKMAAEPVDRERMVGAYRIVGEIGHGGMGTVYLAERADQQFRKQVAIKMARFAGHDRLLLERFRYERQILATLEHPNIARLLDGGETEDGTPFLVMEYVKGSAITDFAAAKDLDLRARLDLFLKVAGAVQHAHQSLIIHRDLKPANILVTEDGEPKLLDFGIAKLLDAGEMSQLNTSTGLRLLTPDYASPEQVRGSPVTTASDVYSLGAVLYELLTGARPHAIQEYTPLGIDQAVCEAPTERPSKAAARTGRLRDRGISGDLDVIVLKAMHKEPSRRYSSVDHFADDVRRFLDARPIQARGDSKWYRAGKFVRRHRIGAAAAVLLLITLIGGIAATSWQAYRAREEARRAEVRFRQVRQLAQRFLFDFDEQIRNLEGSTPARSMVVKTAQEYLDSLASEAAGDPELRRELALAYRKLGDIQGGPRLASMGRSEDALKSYAKSVEIGRSLINEGRKDTGLMEHMIETTRALGLLENRLLPQGQQDRYRERLDQAVALAEGLYRERQDAVSARLLASAYRDRGESSAFRDEPIAAAEYYAKALPVYEDLRRFAPGIRSDRTLAVVTQRLGDAQVMLGNLQRGRELYRSAREAMVRISQATDAGQAERRSVMAIRLSLAAVLADPHIPNLELIEPAMEEMRPALEIAERQIAADPANRTAKIDLAYTEAQFGRILTGTKPEEAARRLKRAVALAEEVWRASGADRVYARHTLQYRKDLGVALAAAGRRAEARTQLERVQTDYDAVQNPGNDHRLVAAAARRELGLLLRSSHPSAAAQHVLQAVGEVEDYYRQHLSSIEVVNNLSRFYEAAAEFQPGYRGKARDLWADWAKSSEYGRQRLNQVTDRL